jgi:predicted polyphosphate/ATP-dependent NAD kinase
VPTVGVIANPASGRDIRRLVAGASVFDNAEKGSMIFRLMAGLGAAGVERVLMMPAADGVGAGLERQLSGRRGALAEARFPALEVLGYAPAGTARDTTRAVEAMCAAGVAAIVVLGGDGTHRVVAAGCGDVPVCALSTGTNNAFPEMREATVAGLAVGLLATGRVPGEVGLVRELAFAVTVNEGDRREVALVDVAVSRERWIASRALWRAENVSEIFVAFASPSAVGLSAVAGLLDPKAHGLHVRLTSPEQAAVVLDVALAPGLIVPIGVASHRRLALHERVTLEPAAGTLALDGEREIERSPADDVEVELTPGPLRVDVDAIMARAAADGLLARA